MRRQNQFRSWPYRKIWSEAASFASLAEPKGNITGVSILSTDLNGKRQEMLLDALQGTKQMVILADTESTSPQQL